jgi:hypothetical protein
VPGFFFSHISPEPDNTRQETPKKTDTFADQDSSSILCISTCIPSRCNKLWCTVRSDRIAWAIASAITFSQDLNLANRPVRSPTNPKTILRVIHILCSNVITPLGQE